MESDWREVRNCLWLHEAEFLKSVLDAAGIEGLIPNEQTLGIQPLYANAMGGVKLLVRRRDFDRAVEVLEARTLIDTTPEDEAAPPTRRD